MGSLAHGLGTSNCCRLTMVTPLTPKSSCNHLTQLDALPKLSYRDPDLLNAHHWGSVASCSCLRAEVYLGRSTVNYRAVEFLFLPCSERCTMIIKNFKDAHLTERTRSCTKCSPWTYEVTTHLWLLIFTWFDSEFYNCLDWSFNNGELLIMDVSIQTLKTNHLGRFQIKSL